MPISLASVKSYLGLALLVVALSVSWANAQSIDIASQVSRLPQLYPGNSEVLASTEHLVNLDNAKIGQRLGADDNQAPDFKIAPDIRTIKVGQQQLMKFSFSDAEGDAYFAGVVALNTRVDLEGGHKTRKQLIASAPLSIRVLNSNDPSVVVWNITAQNPGVTILFVSVAEIFTDTTNGLKLTAGRLKYIAYPLRVVGDRDDTIPPALLNPPSDIALQLKERIQLNFAAASPENRPLSYGFLYLAYATRLIRGRFSNNVAQLKAIEPGKGIFIVYATDGLKADVQTFLVHVADPLDPLPPNLTLRTLSSSAVVARGQDLKLDLYGNNFTSAAQVYLQNSQGKQLISNQYVSDTNLRITFPANFADISNIVVEDGTAQASLKFQPLAPIVSGVKRVRDAQGLTYRLRMQGLNLGRNVKVMINGKPAQIIDNLTVKTEFIDQIVVTIPAQFRNQAQIMVEIRNSTGLQSPNLEIPLGK